MTIVNSQSFEYNMHHRNSDHCFVFPFNICSLRSQQSGIVLLYCRHHVLLVSWLSRFFRFLCRSCVFGGFFQDPTFAVGFWLESFELVQRVERILVADVFVFLFALTLVHLKRLVASAAALAMIIMTRAIAVSVVAIAIAIIIITFTQILFKRSGRTRCCRVTVIATHATTRIKIQRWGAVRIRVIRVICIMPKSVPSVSMSEDVSMSVSVYMCMSVSEAVSLTRHHRRMRNRLDAIITATGNATAIRVVWTITMSDSGAMSTSMHMIIHHRQLHRSL
mmetsp:Transcript_19120/g.30405  ORF Transcript_19120/g.30405 Transcript_19120/m.30405 type:complete len:278 (+) Transcript_19120:225-1058(+)